MIGTHFQRPIIIIGMHRSGTSLVAKLLHDAGVNMGAHRDHNEESMPFLSVNQQMLAAVGNSWIDPQLINVEYSSSESAISMFVNHFQIDPNDYSWNGKPRGWLIKWRLNKPWGFKDPRSTFTLEAWLKLFPKAKVIHVVRHPGSVADSLRRRNDVEGEVYDERLNDVRFNVNLWKQYVERALTQTSRLPKRRVMTIQYEALLEGGQILTDLGRFVGVNLVHSFAERIHPDRAVKPSEIDLSEVADLMSKFGYSQ
ncbi:MAG: sulfotransferase [Flavobacteriia bacterium]|nr:sulfotransferase [Flavobacteriia bacterium]